MKPINTVTYAIILDNPIRHLLDNPTREYNYAQYLPSFGGVPEGRGGQFKIYNSK